jgi:hypothetical protein
VDVLLARGRTRTIFRFSLVLTTSHLIAFSVGLQWGITGVAAMYAVSTTLIEPAQSVLAARALGVSPSVFFRSLAGVFQAGLGMCAIVLATRIGLVDAGVEPALRLVACTGVGLVSYVGLCAWRVPELAQEVRDLLRRRARRTPRVGPQAATVES